MAEIGMEYIRKVIRDLRSSRKKKRGKNMFTRFWWGKTRDAGGKKKNLSDRFFFKDVLTILTSREDDV